MTRSRLTRMLIGLAGSREGLAAITTVAEAWQRGVNRANSPAPASTPAPPRPRGQPLAPWVELADHDGIAKASVAHQEWTANEAATAGLAFGDGDQSWPVARRARIAHLKVLVRRCTVAGRDPDFEQISQLCGIPADACRALVED